MIYTFKEVNSNKKVLFYANDKEAALTEMRVRYGKEAENYSVIAFVDVEYFNLILY